MDQLPTEVLLEIFDYLDNPTFISLLEVCERLKDLILKVSSIRKNLYLEVNPDNIHEMLNLSKIIPFTSIKIMSKEVTTINEIPYRNHLTSSLELKSRFETLEDEIWEIICTHHKTMHDLRLYGLRGGFAKLLLTFCQNLSSLRLSFVSPLSLETDNKGMKRKWTEDENKSVKKYRRNPNKESRDWTLDLINNYTTTTDLAEKQIILDSYDYQIHVRTMQKYSDYSESCSSLTFDREKTELQTQLSKVPQNHFVNLNLLTYLEVFHATDALEWIQAPNLLTLIVHDCVDFDYIDKFLIKCEKLKSLSFLNLKSFSVRNFDSFLFKLSKLRLVMTQSIYADGNSANIFSFVDFLISQKESLKQLSIDYQGISWCAPIILKTIILDLEIEKLTILLYRSVIDFSDLKPNNFVKSLTLAVLLDYENHELIKIFPNVTDLNISPCKCNDLNIFEKISNSMENLEKLDINLHLKFTSSIILKNVTVLKIYQVFVENESDFHKRVFACPNLRDLVLNFKEFQCSNQQMWEILENCQKLQTIQINCRQKFSIPDNYFDIFYKKANKIRKIIFSANITDEEFRSRTENLRKKSKVYIKFRKM